MATTATASHTQLLGTYTAGGHDRELHLVGIPDDPGVLHIIDVLAEPLPEDNDFDHRYVENRIAGLKEAEAIAADYIALAQGIDRPPMPEAWW